MSHCCGIDLHSNNHVVVVIDVIKMNKEADNNIDTNKIDEAALALLFLTMQNEGGLSHAWKSIDWEVLNRLHEKGYIFDPKNKAKSVTVTKEGEEKAESLFIKLFTIQNS